MLLRAINRRTLALLQPINPKLPRPICKVSDLGDFNAPDNSKSPICLTFDDGPEPVYTQKILDILDEYDVKASFDNQTEEIKNLNISKDHSTKELLHWNLSDNQMS